MPRDEEFIKKLLSIFKVEAAEHISSISSGLFRLEKNTSAEEKSSIIEIIYRSAHSLKGASRSVSLRDMESLCQSMEDLLSMLQRGGISLTDEIKSVLNDSNDLLTEMVNADETGRDRDQEIQLQLLKERLFKAAGGTVISGNSGKNSLHKNPDIQVEESVSKTETTDVPVRESETEIQETINHELSKRTIPDRRQRAAEQLLNKQAAAAKETIRVSASKLESLLVKAEELVAVKLAARHYSSEIEDIQRLLVHRSKEWVKIFSDFKKAGPRFDAREDESGNKEMERYSSAMKYLMDFSESMKSDIENRLVNLKRAIDVDSRSTGGLVDDLLIDMKNILLMPFSYTSEGFPKLVREISREQDKEIELILKGTEIEIDKRVLQEMKDPFIHLIRNSIDHGIESASLRKKLGKPEKGIIEVSVNQLDAGRVEIIVSDDGAGINPAEVKSAAVKQGLISDAESEKLIDEEAVNLIFESGVSTSPIITTMSGRGLGMAIVKEKAERLGGSVHVKSVRGKGAAFHIILPVTIATFRGILIDCAGQLFVVPTRNVEKISRVHISEIKTVENRETITYRERAVSLVRLEDILEMPFTGRNENDEFIHIMIIPSGGKYIAFTIDAVLNEDEMLLKNMGRQLGRVRNISGATVLASGKVVMILHVADIIKSASRSGFTSSSLKVANTGENGKSTARRSILVVEDSITARSLYVNILEAVGYNVTSAVDGIDGFTKLINGNFDLVVSDVQMPKMDGFELTEKIRGDARYGDIPVVLVTGLESADDKKRGIDSGANAYIAKSSFDQNNLLEVIERFI